MVTNQKIPDGNWLAGFASAVRKRGGFYIRFVKENKVQLLFQLTQHKRDKQLMWSLIEYFDCGAVYPKSQKREAFDFKVTKFYDIEKKINPFFSKYKIEGVKSKDFADFCRVAELMKTKAHLKAEGLELIRKIKAGMNTRRNWD
jgi:hypothetical protein